MMQIGQWKKVYNVQKHLNVDDVITRCQCASHNSICYSHIVIQKEILAETSHVDVFSFAKNKKCQWKVKPPNPWNKVQFLSLSVAHSAFLCETQQSSGQTVFERHNWLSAHYTSMQTLAQCPKPHPRWGSWPTHVIVFYITQPVLLVSQTDALDYTPSRETNRR